MRPGAGRTVTFVGHDASRTGAPVVLGSMLRWLSREGEPGVRLVLIRGGPLLDEYRRVAPTELLDGPVQRGLDRLSAAARSVGIERGPTLLRLGSPARRVAGSDVVVSNTLAALRVARVLARSRSGKPSRLVCYVHELDGVAARTLPADPAARRDLLGSVDRFVAAGRAVATMLVDRMHVPDDRVAVVEPFIEAALPAPSAVRRVREAMLLGEARPIVLSVGALIRRKGPERFVDLMGALSNHPKRPLGVWLGGEHSGSVWDETRADIVRSPEPGSVRTIANLAGAASYIAAADVVVSTAVEDPFPLSVLEAAALGVPVVGFDSGGLADVLRGSGQGDLVCGIGDVLGMRDVVSALLDDDAARAERGRRMAEWVRAHHLVDQSAPALWDIISS